MIDDIAVLDKGFVYLVDKMGGDLAVVQAARVCYKSDGRKDPQADAKLIQFLLTHDHGTPFEHAVLKFHIKAPIFVARQWFRHRMSSYNEVSGRYTEVQDQFYIPDKWRSQDTKNKQGSNVADLRHEVYGSILEVTCNEAMESYRLMLAGGVAKEMARMVLPVNLYTEFYWTVNARALMHFIKLRSESHAQWEIKQYSHALWRYFARTMPWTAHAFLGTLDLNRYCTQGAGSAGPNYGDIEVPVPQEAVNA